MSLTFSWECGDGATAAGGADPNKATTDEGITPLLTSSLGGHLELTILLLDWGADPNKASTDSGTTPLILAAKDRTET